MVFNALTFARFLGRCWKPRSLASVFNTSLGTWRLLMHEKPCLIPILMSYEESKWASSSKKVPLKMNRFRSSGACTKYLPGLCSPFIQSLVSNDSISGQWRPWSDCASAQSELSLCCPHDSKAILLCGAQRCIIYHIYPKYWDTVTAYHTCPKNLTSPFYYLLMCP